MKNISTIIKNLLLAGFAAVGLFIFFTGLDNLNSDQQDEGRLRLEGSLRRAAVACYAAEGIYPPNIAYLQEHYGVQIDEDNYAVFYDIFGSNMMPDITVLDK